MIALRPIPRSAIVACLTIAAGFGAFACRGGDRPADPTPSPAPTSSATPSEPMRIAGSAWLNARPAAALVEAFIGGTKCAERDAVIGPDDHYAIYSVFIPPEGQMAGCGGPGRTVTFRVGGVPANETLSWESGARLIGPSGLDLTGGPPFARYIGTFTYLGSLPPPATLEIQPLIDGKVCGKQLNFLLGAGPEFGYEVAVDPEELSPGCGRIGAIVSFRLVACDDAGQQVFALCDEEHVRVVAELRGTEQWMPGRTERGAAP